MLGECLRRGYQVVSSKVIVPQVKKNGWFAKYAKWSFENATNLYMGRKFSLLSLPNTIMWSTAYMVTGALVSKEYAKKSWKQLYKDKQ
jgi:hypothetical protein